MELSSAGISSPNVCAAARSGPTPGRLALASRVALRAAGRARNSPGRYTGPLPAGRARKPASHLMWFRAATPRRAEPGRARPLIVAAADGLAEPVQRCAGDPAGGRRVGEVPGDGQQVRVLRELEPITATVLPVVPADSRTFPGAACRYRSGLNAARISVANSSGSSQAAKWPPLSASWK